MAEITRGMKVHSSISRLQNISPSAMENRLNEATNSMVQCSLNTSSDADESAFSISKCDSTLGKLISLLLSLERININIVRCKQFARPSNFIVWGVMM